MVGDTNKPTSTPSTSTSISAGPISTDYAEASTSHDSTSRNTIGQRTYNSLDCIIIIPNIHFQRQSKNWRTTSTVSLGSSTD